MELTQVTERPNMVSELGYGIDTERPNMTRLFIYPLLVFDLLFIGTNPPNSASGNL